MKKNLLIALIFMLFLASCTTEGDDSNDSQAENLSTSTTETELISECGTNREALLFNPISSTNLLQFVKVVDSNLVIVRALTGDILVKLQGLGLTNSFKRNSAISFLNSIATSDVYFEPAATDCTTIVEGGGTALVGQIFNSNGQSFTEELIKSGLAGEIETTGLCGDANLAGCYFAMREANTLKSAGQLTDFLWKPSAESGFNQGNPVILANPCNATVYVNGEALIDFGSSNGRCNTSRLFERCGTYGNNIKVEVIDNASGLPYFNGAEPFVIVPSGCGRFEFKR